MAVIGIHKAHLTHVQDPGLVIQILLKIRVLIRTDVVRGNVGKDTVIKGDPIHPVHLDPLRGYLHNHILASALCHLGKCLVQLPGLLRGVHGGGNGVAYDDSRGSDHSHLFACRFQYGFDHMGRGGLSLCSGDPDGDHLFSRITKPGRG